MDTAPSSPIPSQPEKSSLGPFSHPFQSILVATDCTQSSATAVNLAARLAKEFHARLFVLHSVVPELFAVDGPGPVPELAAMDLQVAGDKLHRYAEHIPELRTVKHKEVVFLGPVTDAIQSTGQSNRIDLLVLGSHGHDGLAKLTFGSVAEWVIGRLNYPVLVVGPACDKNFHPIRSILLATDLGPQASRPAQYAASLAQGQNACLAVIHVLPAAASSPEEQAQTERSANRELHQLIPINCHDDCTLDFEVTSGDATQAILQSARAHKANLIVLGARHKPPLADHIPRTKLSAVIREAHCPVLVVPARSS